MRPLPTLEQLKTTSFQQLLDPNFQQQLARQKKAYFIMKRVIDIAAAFILLILLSPIFIIITIAIRLDSKGKALFSHERIGQNGKPFIMYKFRTMRHDADAQEFAPTTAKDPRVTPIGQLLRRLSLDELPQLWHILSGEMSLIGPRPEMAFIVETYTPLQRARLLAKPGLTGLWQIAGRKDIPLHENVEYDLYYILHQSPALDLHIFLNTFIVVFSGRGAY